MFFTKIFPNSCLAARALIVFNNLKAETDFSIVIPNCIQSVVFIFINSDIKFSIKARIVFPNNSFDTDPPWNFPNWAKAMDKYKTRSAVLFSLITRLSILTLMLLSLYSAIASSFISGFVNNSFNKLAKLAKIFCIQAESKLSDFFLLERAKWYKESSRAKEKFVNKLEGWLFFISDKAAHRLFTKI